MGSRSFANDLPEGVTVSNYLNLDMAGVNYPGDYALSVYLGPDGTEDVVDQAGMYYLAEWIGADALDLGMKLSEGEKRGLRVEKARCGVTSTKTPWPSTSRQPLVATMIRFRTLALQHWVGMDWWTGTRAITGSAIRWRP